MAATMPWWEQRLRSPQLRAFSLLGPTVSWASDIDRGVLLSNVSGRFEVFAFDTATRRPADLRQVTDRSQGTVGAAVAPDGEHVLWFDDRDGDEVGRWRRQPFAGGAETVLLPELPATFGSGLVARRGGGAVVGRTDDAGFAIAVADVAGCGSVVYESPDQSTLVDVDGQVAVISRAPDGDLMHPVVCIVDLLSGGVVAELADPGLGLRPVAFSPVGDGRVLAAHTRHDRTGLLVWSPSTGEVDEVQVDLDGDVNGRWLHDASGLLLIVSLDGRDSIHRFDFATGSTSRVPSPRGVVTEVSTATQRFDPCVGRQCRTVATSGGARGRSPRRVRQRTRSFGSVREHRGGGAGWSVHAFLHRPLIGAAPYPTVFMVHGGPPMQDTDRWSPVTAALVDAGYAVVRVNYRGSTGYGRKWRDALIARLGAIELEDIDAVRDRLEANGFVDPNRIAVAGASWGGYLTLFALGVEPDRWAAGVALVPLADFAMSQQDQPAFMTAEDHALFGGTLEELPDAYRAASPLTYVDAVQAPVLITAGTNDPRCPPRPTDEYVSRLRARNADVVYQRNETGHQPYDDDRVVEQVRLMLDFLTSRMPAGRPGTPHN